VDVLLVDQRTFFDRAVVALEQLDVVLLDAHRLLDDGVVRTRDALGEEGPPLTVGERDAVECLELGAQVRDELASDVIGRYS
jgi:hypothetical protein